MLSFLLDTFDGYVCGTKPPKQILRMKQINRGTPMWWVFAFILLGLYVALALVRFNNSNPSDSKKKHLGLDE